MVMMMMRSVFTAEKEAWGFAVVFVHRLGGGPGSGGCCWCWVVAAAEEARVVARGGMRR